MGGEDSGVETGLGDPALQILCREVAGAAFGGPTGQGRAVVCRIKREQAGSVCDKRLPLLRAPLISRPSCGLRTESFGGRGCFGTAAGRAAFAGPLGL